MWISRLVSRLRESDPGLLRFRQALKSVLAVAVALAVFHGRSPIASLFVGLSTAFLMQCVDSGSLRRQQASMAATAAGIMIFAPLGSSLHGHRGAEAALLIFWAAAVYYARRFLKGNGGFTLFSFTEVLLATALPGNPKLQFVTAATGFGIAFVVRFFVWPADEAAAFDDAVRIFARQAARLEENPSSRDGGRLLDSLREALHFSANLLTERPELDAHGARRAIVKHEYERLQALRMLREAMRRQVEEPTATVCTGVHAAIAELAFCRLREAAPVKGDEASLRR